MPASQAPQPDASVPLTVTCCPGTAVAGVVAFSLVVANSGLVRMCRTGLSPPSESAVIVYRRDWSLDQATAPPGTPPPMPKERSSPPAKVWTSPPWTPTARIPSAPIAREVGIMVPSVIFGTGYAWYTVIEAMS